MPSLSRKTIFAIEAVLDVALHSTEAAVRSADITRRHDIPRRYLEQVLQRLVRTGILAGKRGPNGGYRLGRERRRISIGDIVRVVGQLEATCEPRDASADLPVAHAVVWQVWQSLRSELVQKLDMITIEDLCRKAREHDGKISSRTSLDYAI